MKKRILYILFSFLLLCGQAFAQTTGKESILLHLHDGQKWAFPMGETDSITFPTLSDSQVGWLYGNQVHKEVLVRTYYVSSATNNWYYSLENPQVTKFLNEVTYDNNDYSISSINNYYNYYTSYKKDQPTNVGITCKENVDSVVLSERFDFQGKNLQRCIDFSGKRIVFCNLIPQKTYYYKAFLTDGTVSQSHFHTYGNLRMIRADSVRNVRDIGGWRTKDGHRIAYGKIFRGGEMDGIHDTHITQQDSLVFRDLLNIGLDIDFRKAEETDSTGISPLGKDITYKHYEVVYYQPDSEGYYDAFRDVLECLRGGKAAYIHCVMGADRTGMLAYMMGAILGVPEEDLCKDFELTTFCGQPRYRNGNRMLTFNTRLAAFGGKDIQERIENMMLSKGITREEIEEFKQMMLEK